MCGSQQWEEVSERGGRRKEGGEEADGGGRVGVVGGPRRWEESSARCVGSGAWWWLELPSSAPRAPFQDRAVGWVGLVLSSSAKTGTPRDGARADVTAASPQLQSLPGPVVQLSLPPSLVRRVGRQQPRRARASTG